MNDNAFIVSIYENTVVTDLTNANGELLDYVRFRITDVDNGENLKFTINGNYYEFDRHATTESSAIEPIICLTTEEAELAYLQDSFELRYPDADDYGADYGYLGMNVDAYHFRTELFGGARLTSNIPVSFFNTDELILEDSVNSISKQEELTIFCSFWIAVLTHIE